VAIVKKEAGSPEEKDASRGALGTWQGSTTRGDTRKGQGKVYKPDRLRELTGASRTHSGGFCQGEKRKDLAGTVRKWQDNGRVLSHRDDETL